MTNRFTAGLPQILERCQPLQVGFIPDSDCAPLVYAHESGLFQRYELDVELKRETRWATIRDKAPDEELTSGAGRNPSIFFRHNANEPTEQKAAWVMGQLHELMAQNVLKLPPAMRVPALKNVFLPDIFQRTKTAALNQMEALKREADRYEAKLKEPA
jgi:hypothetical protein